MTDDLSRILKAYQRYVAARNVVRDQLFDLRGALAEKQDSEGSLVMD